MNKFVERLKEKSYEAVETDHFFVDIFGIIRNKGCAPKLENEFKKVTNGTSEFQKLSEVLKFKLSTKSI